MALILLVDDDHAILELLESVFADEGYQTVSATNGRQALSALESRRADVVVSDVMMPFVDGRELARTIATTPAYRHIPVILVSAGAAARLGDVPAAAVLSKPFNIDELLSTVARLLPKG